MSVGAVSFSAAVVGLALAAISCGGNGRPQPPDAERPLTRSIVEQRELGLTSALPQDIRRACRKLTEAYRGTVYCPPLVPDGEASRQYVGGKNRRPGDASSTYSLDFNSVSLSSIGGARVDANGGHWVVEAGRAGSLRDDLGLYIPPRLRRGRIKLSKTRIEGQAVRIYRLACCFEVYLAGHYTALWRRDGVTYVVSIHGFRNRPRVLAMAGALIRLQKACEQTSTSAEPCVLAMRGRR